MNRDGVERRVRPPEDPPCPLAALGHLARQVFEEVGGLGCHPPDDVHAPRALLGDALQGTERPQLRLPLRPALGPRQLRAEAPAQARRGQRAARRNEGVELTRGGLDAEGELALAELGDKARGLVVAAVAAARPCLPLVHAVSGRGGRQWHHELAHGAGRACGGAAEKTLEEPCEGAGVDATQRLGVEVGEVSAREAGDASHGCERTGVGG
eukprot:CAMPEP_0176219410 /NCGR_PEP_ID=MMETSP0121_2-20121125/18694_1 /TAXON_ID=160619 /ORGANISM="Kryptoperidinium foliaceum, Strain CCMP 1326" /LENGTH=210 /DNA_ID=CAMNT_0017558571 /DNA_START=134 /DNA_END=763 /DNA_ORIENTATION=+